jgi:glycosyltransferase involved in cell wall biosynthesis
MQRRINVFFQHMPPYSGAAALRGASVVAGLVALPRLRECVIHVYTTTPSATQLPGVTVMTLPAAEVENAQSLLSRALGELRMGWHAARMMFVRPTDMDMAIISTPGYVAALVIAAYARWREVPYVLELRDVYPQVYAEAGLLRKNSLAYRFLARRSQGMYEGARQIIAATQGLHREVSSQAPRAKVAWVYNGFPSSLRQRKATKHQRFTVCFHGVLGFFQDVETLIAVARKLASAGVDVVAIGYGRKEAPLRQASLPNLRFLGRLSFEDTIAAVEQCHLGLCLRLDDGISKDAFPVKVWEYIGLGIPCIVTPHCEAGDFLQKNGCGLQLQAGNVQAIAQAVLGLKDNRAALAAMTQRCWETGSAYTREETGLAAARLVEAAILDHAG